MISFPYTQLFKDTECYAYRAYIDFSRYERGDRHQRDGYPKIVGPDDSEEVRRARRERWQLESVCDAVRNLGRIYGNAKRGFMELWIYGSTECSCIAAEIRIYGKTEIRSLGTTDLRKYGNESRRTLVS